MHRAFQLRVRDSCFYLFFERTFFIFCTLIANLMRFFWIPALHLLLCSASFVLHPFLFKMPLLCACVIVIVCVCVCVCVCLIVSVCLCVRV